MRRICSTCAGSHTAWTTGPGTELGLDRGVGERRLEESEDTLGQLAQVGRANVGLRPAPAIQTGAYDAGYTIDLGEQEPNPLDRSGLPQREHVVAQQLQVPAQRVERRPDFVGEGNGGLLQ